MDLQNKENLINSSRNLLPGSSSNATAFSNPLTKHASNKRFSHGPVLEHACRTEQILRKQDMNVPRKDLNITTKDRFCCEPSILSSVMEEEDAKPAADKGKSSPKDEVRPEKTVVLESPEKLGDEEVVKQRGNQPKVPNESTLENDKSTSDPLIKYRSAHKLFAKPTEPKEITLGTNEHKKMILILVLLFSGLMLLNYLILGGNGQVSKKTEASEIGNEQEMKLGKINDMQKIYESSNEKINESYKRLGAQIYQRMKVQVQTHKSISLSKLEQDLDERYGEALKEKIWPIVTSLRSEENEILEKIEGNEKIWVANLEEN